MSDFHFSKPKLLEKIESGEKYDRNEAWMIVNDEKWVSSDQKAFIKRFVQKIKVFKNCLNFDPKILIFIVICLILKKFWSTPCFYKSKFKWWVGECNCRYGVYRVRVFFSPCGMREICDEWWFMIPYVYVYGVIIIRYWVFWPGIHNVQLRITYSVWYF